MKKAIVVMCFLCTMYATYAQQARPTSGGEALGSGDSASYTIGQVITLKTHQKYKEYSKPLQPLGPVQ
jgi:hypothetical protein